MTGCSWPRNIRCSSLPIKGCARTAWKNRKTRSFSLINLLISIFIALRMIGFVEWCTYGGQLCLIKSPFSSTANARPQAKKRKVATKITVSKNRRGRQIKQFAIAKIKQYMPRMSFFNTPYFFLEIVTPRRIRRQVNQYLLGILVG